ncbi:hypothetical protein [Streptomyces sp. UNOC14_S4]|uniref:hypothetical protein n=1 Tax=Streptomyces sp. UNOC14_S4 TaxID=2872340 RepID=UPI001E35319E|nr:hypothetical protein [Streptomyces sp. UNOC14_S4]MCC3767816.1 hypothetical protein [Streptomyces sp. UNOC14_S4]
MVLGGVAVAAVVAAQALARMAFAFDTLSLPIVGGVAECTVTWHKAGVAMRPATPGSVPSSYALSDVTGTLNVAGDPVALALDPARFAQAVSYTAAGTGGFTLTDAQGHTVELSEPELTAPLDGFTYVVKTPTTPSGTRMAVFGYPDPARLDPKLTSETPPEITVDGSASLVAASEFAKAVNDAFGRGSLAEGAPFGTCTGQARTG